MRKSFFLFIFIVLNVLSFSKEITFNFNRPTGKIEFFKAGDINTTSLSFYEGSATLDLDKKEYYFLFTSEEFPAIEKVIDIKNTSAPIEINFSKENHVVVKGSIKSGEANIGDVKISFINSENLSYNFTSDIFGNFTAIIPPGKYSIKVERFGYSLADKSSLIYDFSQRVKPYEVKLNLSELPSMIQGRVIDENGNSIPFTHLSVKNGANIFQTSSDDFGMFKFPVKSGIVTILAQKDGYTQNGVVRTIEKDSSITNIEIPLTREKYSISGVVTNGVKALPNVELQLMGEDLNKITSTRTDENGYFEFYKISGNIQVSIYLLENNKVIKKSDTIQLNKDFRNFNIIVD